MAILRVDPGGYSILQNGLEALIQGVLEHHPFTSEPLTQDSRLVLTVSIEAYRKTATDHSRYSDSGDVRIWLDENDVFDRTPRHSVDYSRLGSSIVHVLHHELAHFIDARRRPEFGYHDELRPAQPEIVSAHYHLWCSYIDGRLAKLAPHTLSFRQKDAAVAGIEADDISAAWTGVFANYPSIVRRASEIVALRVKA